MNGTKYDSLEKSPSLEKETPYREREMSFGDWMMMKKMDEDKKGPY